MTTPAILILLAGLLALSAVISASETAFFTLRPWRVERLRRDRPIPGGIIAESLRDPRVFLVTIIVGTELVNVASSNLAAMLSRRWEGPQAALRPGGLSLLAGVAVTSGVLILVCDIIPKTLAVAFPEAIALRLSRPVWLLLRLLRPAALPIARLTSFLTEPGRSRARAGGAPAPLSEEDFRMLIEISRREGVLKPSQTEMIEAAFRLGDLKVRQVMVPRTDIVAISHAATFDEAVALVRQGRHSRIPVFRESLDDIVGVLYAKDLLVRRSGLAPRETAGLMARPALFVPEVMKARQLVRQLQDRKVHLGIVVDEYGGTAGVVTLEDLLEEMVGEFSDEFERPVRVFRRLRRGLFWVRASMPLPEFCRRARARLKDPEVDTVGGYVLKLFGRVPAEGDSVSDDSFSFTVRRMKGRRILVLLVRRRGAGEEQGRQPGAAAREGSARGE